MAYNNRYQYETSPRKLKPEYEPNIKKRTRKNTAKKAKTQRNKKQQAKVQKKFKNHVKIVKYVLIGFGILFAISYRNSVINEKFAQIKNLKTNLAAVEKENEQLKVNIENSLNLKNVEQSAKETLGMQKLDKSQTVYINLPKEDYVEAATEEIKTVDNTSLLQKIIRFITGK